MAGLSNIKKCPVCGTDVDESSRFSGNHQNEIYYFCSENHKKEFQKEASLCLRQREKAA